MVLSREVRELGRPAIELGEPEAWLESMRRGARSLAQHELAHGDEALARRWERLAQALQLAADVVERDQQPRRLDAVRPNPLADIRPPAQTNQLELKLT
jgi:hypothetical protein